MAPHSVTAPSSDGAKTKGVDPENSFAASDPQENQETKQEAETGTASFLKEAKEVLISPPKEFKYFEHLTLSTRYQEWNVWYQYKFKHPNAAGQQGREITNVKIGQYLLKGALHLWGPFTVFTEGGWQNGEVTYDKKFSRDSFDINLNVKTIAPSSVLGAGLLMKLWGEDGEAFYKSSLIDFSVENGVSFVMTHREIRANELTLDMGEGLKADFSKATGTYIEGNRVTYQMAIFNTKATVAVTPLKWFVPFGSVGQTYLDTRLYLTPTPIGYKLLKLGGVQWGEVREDLNLKEIGWMYEAGATSDILTLGGLLIAKLEGLPVDATERLSDKVALLATIKRGYMPLQEGRNKFKADTRTYELGFQYTF